MIVGGGGDGQGAGRGVAVVVVFPFRNRIADALPLRVRLGARVGPRGDGGGVVGLHITNRKQNIMSDDNPDRPLRPPFRWHERDDGSEMHPVDWLIFRLLPLTDYREEIPRIQKSGEIVKMGVLQIFLFPGKNQQPGVIPLHRRAGSDQLGRKVVVEIREKQRWYRNQIEIRKT